MQYMVYSSVRDVASLRLAHGLFRHPENVYASALMGLLHAHFRVYVCTAWILGCFYTLGGPSCGCSYKKSRGVALILGNSHFDLGDVWRCHVMMHTGCMGCGSLFKAQIYTILVLDLLGACHTAAGSCGIMARHT